MVKFFKNLWSYLINQPVSLGVNIDTNVTTPAETDTTGSFFQLDPNAGIFELKKVEIHNSQVRLRIEELKTGKEFLVSYQWFESLFVPVEQTPIINFTQSEDTQ